MRHPFIGRLRRALARLGMTAKVPPGFPAFPYIHSLPTPYPNHGASSNAEPRFLFFARFMALGQAKDLMPLLWGGAVILRGTNG